MSIHAYYQLADWPRLEQAITEAGSKEAYLEKYTDEQPAWLTSPEMSPAHGHWNAATVAYYVHEAIANELTAATRSKLEALLRTFGIIEGEAAHDLGVHPEFFTLTLSPATVSTVLAQSEGLDWEEIRTAYLQHYEPNPNWWLPTIDDFIDYVVGFRELLEMAKRQGRGIVVNIA